MFYGNAQVQDRERGYLRVAIPPHIIEELKLAAGDRIVINIEKTE